MWKREWRTAAMRTSKRVAVVATRTGTSRNSLSFSLTLFSALALSRTKRDVNANTGGQRGKMRLCARAMLEKGVGHPPIPIEGDSANSAEARIRFPVKRAAFDTTFEVRC